MGLHSKKSFKNLGLILLATMMVAGAYGLFDEASAQIQNASMTMTESMDHGSIMDAYYTRAIEAGRVGERALADKNALRSFYAERGGKTFWTDGDDVHRRADYMYKAIEESWTHGLNPYKYHYPEIYNLLEKDDESSLAELELLLTDAFIRYARDLSGKRVSGQPFNLDEKDWKHPMSAQEAALYLSESERDFRKTLKNLEPAGQTYQILRKELIRLANEGPHSREELLPIAFKGIMRPGWDHKEVPVLREFLGLDQPSQGQYIYDDELVSAVMRFQRENALNADGVIGSNTMEVINRTNKDKMKQLVANLERLRWVDNTGRGDKFVIVNLPSAKLWAIDDGDVEFDMDIIVGSPERRTRSFKTEIVGVRLNPDWTVPPTIKRYDILPKLQDDISYLSDKGMELYSGYGSQAVTLDPSSIDWESLSNRDLHGIRMVQGPGDNNPLGRYRLLMPNDYNIYLHDTNHPELFAKPERAVSSGCMRMKDPERMAEFLLRDIDGWSNSKTRNIINSYKKTDISIPNKVPVYIFYYTAWVGDNGQVVYGNDIYNYDSKLIDSLRKLDGFHIPSHNSNYQGNVSNAHLVSYQ